MRTIRSGPSTENSCQNWIGFDRSLEASSEMICAIRWALSGSSFLSMAVVMYSRWIFSDM